MPYPTTFSEQLTPLREVDLLPEGQAALQTLETKGFEVVAGVRRADVAEITAIAQQEGVREFCARDAKARFGDEPMMERWLAKNGGRGMFLVRDLASKAIAGYGWTGLEPCDELPDYPITSAFRLSETTAGNGLGAPLTKAIVFGSMALFGAEGIGLETWASNTKAVRSYVRAGAELVTTRDDVRPTLHPAANEVDGKRRDVRLFMKFPFTSPGSVALQI